MQGIAEFESLTAADLEALDPHPDVHALFYHYNQLYFDNCLGACSVEWSSKRMTLCAGVCHFQRGGGCRIKLSEPLLKYRPVKDLKETLLHEMIHAELFLKGVRDDGDHGPKFRARMDAINKATFLDTQRPAEGYNITVYHTMHDEVNLYRTHVWCCNRCGNTVKRSMNRPPQEADCRAYSKAVAAAAAAAGAPGSYCQDERCWYHSHARLCGGQYNKIQEPEKKQPTASSRTTSSTLSGSNKRIKQPAAPGTTGAMPIEAFFKPDRQLAQQQQQQDKQQRQDAIDQQQQQRQADLQEGIRTSQQQHTSQDYWQALGQGRLLGGSCHRNSSQAVGQLGPGRSSSQQQQHVQQAGWQPQAQAQQQSKQQQQPKPHKRAAPPSAQQQLHQQAQDIDSIVELLSSDDEDDSAGVDAAAAAAGSGQGMTRRAGQATTEPSVPCAVACPVCCQLWLPGEISNEQLNLHLDACLARMHC